MRYQKLGKLNWDVSALGFGTMRLPVSGSDTSKINEQEAIHIIRYGIDQGINYIDTGYRYHGGNCETIVGKALKLGYRDRIKVAAKMPSMLVNTESDMDKFLNEQLSKLQTDHIDFYLLHGLRRERWEKLKALNVLEWLQKKQSEGKIVHTGFSFHDEFSVFKEILDSTDMWDICQIIFNYIDDEFQAGTTGSKYAASKGVPVAIMEPIGGGKLAYPPSKAIQDIWDKSLYNRSPADWALRWVWNHPEVSVVLSGMSSTYQIDKNAKIASDSGPDLMTQEEMVTINRVKRKYKELGFIKCSGCRYCMPCPEGVNIPLILSLYNKFYMQNRADSAKKDYNQQVDPQQRAKKCKRCGSCEDQCPQEIPIRNILNDASRIFDDGRQF